MAFALAVARGDRPIGECPYVDPSTAGAIMPDEKRKDPRDELTERLQPLRQALSEIDFDDRAPKIGGRIERGALVIPCLGKEFRVSGNGTIESDIHVNPWISVPLLKYILTGGGGDGRPGSTGPWIAFADLSTGIIRGQYFVHRCEEPLREIVDGQGPLFSDLMKMFSAQRPAGIEVTKADEAWLLRPLPRVPLLLRYWRPEDEFPSKLKILLGSDVERYLDPESAYILIRGMVEMLERLTLTHRVPPPRYETP